MLTVNHFSTYSQGGAAMAALRIADGFPVDEVNSRFFFHQEEAGSRGQALKFKEPRQDFLYRKLKAKKVLREFQEADAYFQEHLAGRDESAPSFSPARSFWSTEIEGDAFHADILHLHWVAFLFDYPTFFRSIGKQRPIVWTLHDMNPVTGGCHYANECRNYESGCGNCPQLTKPGDLDISSFSYRHKRESLSRLSIDVVSPSRWLLEVSKKSQVFSNRTRWHQINYGIDTISFSPLKKREAKKQMGFDPDRLLLLFAAQDLSDPRKGFKQLHQALGRLPDSLDFQIAVFGNGELDSDHVNRKIESLGFLDTDQKKQLAYSAADSFVLPSLQDNQPQTGLESLACGTPVVAFRAGGIPEFVQHEKTGLLAKTGSADDLAAQLERILTDESARVQFGSAGRELILKEFELKKQTEKYMQVYQNILRPRRFLRPNQKVA